MNNLLRIVSNILTGEINMHMQQEKEISLQKN